MKTSEADSVIKSKWQKKYWRYTKTSYRKYANHPSGRKYDTTDCKKVVRPQAADALTSDKAKSAGIFKEYREKVMNDELYQEMRERHKEIEKQAKR